MEKISNVVALISVICFLLGAETLGINIFVYTAIFIIPLYTVWKLLLVITKRANGEEW